MNTVAPKAAYFITKGQKTWVRDTSRLPMPALRPRASPCWALGKKKLMLLMDEAKAPPPTPENMAATTKDAYVQSVLRSAL